MAWRVFAFCASFQQTISGHRINHRNGTFIAITRPLNATKEIVILRFCPIFCIEAMHLQLHSIYLRTFCLFTAKY